MREREYLVNHLLVFPANLEGGNQCPIVFGLPGMKREEMQNISAFYKLETGFILPPMNNYNDLSLKYFVPNYEMEMCVHATVGAIYLLSNEKKIKKSHIRIETALGVIAAEIRGNLIFVEQFSPIFSIVNPGLEEVCKALNISGSAIDNEIGPIQTVSTSRPKLVVPLKNYEVLASLKPNFEVLWDLCDEYEITGVYPFTDKTRQPGFDVETRQFPKKVGYPEDPATGVAAGALGAYLVKHKDSNKKLDSLATFTYNIGQGFDMGKPSQIITEIVMKDGEFHRVKVGGKALLLKKESISINNNGIVNKS